MSGSNIRPRESGGDAPARRAAAPRRVRRRGEIVRVVVALLILASADYLGVFEGLNRSLYDLTFRLRGSRAADPSILIAAVDEPTLKILGRWPVRRLHYARLLEFLAKARAVGFDLILTEPSEDDALFAEAARRHGRVVIGAEIRSNLDIVPPPPPLDSLPRGHVYVEPGTDGIFREVYHTLVLSGTAIPSLSSRLYEIALGRPWPREAAAPGAGRSGALFQKDLRRIDFYGGPGTFRTVSVADILAGAYPQAAFENKIVLVGVTSPGLEALRMIPFTSDRNALPGVEIHAHILNNLLDGKSIVVPPKGLFWTVLGAAGLLFFLLLRRLSEGRALLVWGLSLAVVSGAAFGLMAAAGVWIIPGLALIVSALTALLAYIFRLDEAARRLDEKFGELNVRMSAAPGQRLLFPATGVVGYLHERGLQAKIGRLLEAERAYESALEATVHRRTNELSQALGLINQLSDEIILRLSMAVEVKERGTGEHITRIRLYVSEIARALDWPADRIEALAFASSMHDLGKIGIPDTILLKAAALSEEEFAVMKEHTRIGENILSRSGHPKIQMSAAIALNHHEKWNGEGYPRGLRGNEIPLEARIVAICDQYDSLRSERPYKPALDHDRVLKVLLEGDGRTKPDHFDPDVLRAFLQKTAEFKAIFDRVPSR